MKKSKQNKSYDESGFEFCNQTDGEQTKVDFQKENETNRSTEHLDLLPGKSQETDAKNKDKPSTIHKNFVIAVITINYRNG